VFISWIYASVVLINFFKDWRFIAHVDGAVMFLAKKRALFASFVKKGHSNGK
jgi:hypothetical protein